MKIKYLIPFILLLFVYTSFAGSVTDAHKKVTARKNAGGGASEYTLINQTDISGAGRDIIDSDNSYGQGFLIDATTRHLNKIKIYITKDDLPSGTCTLTMRVGLSNNLKTYIVEKVETFTDGTTGWFEFDFSGSRDELAASTVHYAGIRNSSTDAVYWGIASGDILGQNRVYDNVFGGWNMNVTSTTSFSLIVTTWD